MIDGPDGPLAVDQRHLVARRKQKRSRYLKSQEISTLVETEIGSGFLGSRNSLK